MKHGFVASFVLFLSSLTLAAQSTTTALSQNKTIGIEGPAAGCPASFRARQAADGTLLNAATGHPRGIGQRILLTANPDSREIMSATVTVRGSTPAGHVAQTNLTNRAPDEAAQTLNARFSPVPDGTTTAVLWAAGFTAVTSIEVDAVTYADGSTWKGSGGQACKAALDLLMPVTAR